MGPALEGEIGKAKGEIELGSPNRLGSCCPPKIAVMPGLLSNPNCKKSASVVKRKAAAFLSLYDNLEELLDAKNGVALVDFVVESLYYARTTGVPCPVFSL